MSDLGATRRSFVGAVALGLLAAPLGAAPRLHLRALAFDAFVLFDPRGVFARAHELAGERAGMLVKAASAKIFAYSWYLTSAQRYENFETLADAAFRSAAGTLGIELHDADYKHIVSAYSALPAWPDAEEALGLLASRGIRLAMLSNFSEPMLRSNLELNGMERRFEHVLSTDQVRKFKPAPQAYALGVRAFGLPKEQIGFAASAGWDASGASWFGYPTAWINRTKEPGEPAHGAPQVTSGSIEGVLRLAAVSAPTRTL